MAMYYIVPHYNFEQIILSILNLNLWPWNRFYLVQLRDKEINRLISKRMSNIYLKVTIEKKWCRYPKL